MKTVLEKHLQRQVALLDELVQEQWRTVPELAQKTHFSARTIRNDLKELKTYLAPATIITDNRFGVRLLLPENIPTSFLYQQIFGQSKAFELLESILLANEQSVSQLAEKFYWSETSLRRELKRIDSALNRNQIQLTFKPLQLIGDEETIIWSFHQYFLERYGSLEFAISETESNLVAELLNEFFAINPQLISPSRESYAYLNHLRILTFIRLHRLANKHLTEIPFAKQTTIKLTFSKKLHLRLQAFYNLTLDQAHYQQIFTPFFAHHFIQREDQLASLSATTTYYQAGQRFFERLASQKFTVVEQETLLISILNYLSQIHGTTKILYSEKESFTRGLREFYPNFAELMTKEIQSFLEEASFTFPINDAIVNEILFLILMIWQDWHQQLKEQAPRLIAALLFNTTYSHHLFLKRQIEIQFGDLIEVIPIAENTLATFFATSNRYDLLLTNLAQLNNIDCPTITLHSNPTQADFQKIARFYEQKTGKKIRPGNN